MAASLSLAPAASFASTARATSVEPSSPTPVMHQSTTASAAPTQKPKKASADEQRYAAREQASPDAANYRGGDTLVIGATAATAILAVLLLVVLL